MKTALAYVGAVGLFFVIIYMLAVIGEHAERAARLIPHRRRCSHRRRDRCRCGRHRWRTAR